MPPPLASLGACRRGLSLCSRPGAMACVSPSVAGKNKTPKSAAGAQTPLISDGYLQARPHRCPSSAGRRRRAAPPPPALLAGAGGRGGVCSSKKQHCRQLSSPAPVPPPPKHSPEMAVRVGHGKAGSKDPEPIQRQPHCPPQNSLPGDGNREPPPHPAAFQGALSPQGCPISPPHRPDRSLGPQRVPPALSQQHPSSASPRTMRHATLQPGHAFRAPDKSPPWLHQP